MYLSLRVRSRARNAFVDIAGDIDMNSGPWLEDSLLRLLRISGTCLLADLSGVTFIDCAGMRMLITTCRTAELQASALRFTNLSPQVRRLADLTGLRDALPLAVPREGRVLPERTGQLTAPQRPADACDRRGRDTAGLHGRRFRAAALVLRANGAAAGHTGADRCD
jgi:anti-anti-sigma factor